MSGSSSSTPPSRSKKAFEEVELPFDIISDDHIKGDKLREALKADEVDNSMRDYSVFDVEQEDDLYEFRAVKDSTFPYLFPSNEAYIAFELRDSDKHEYSHMRVEMGAPDKRVMDELYRGVRDLENGLETYFRNQRFGDGRIQRAAPHTAD